MQCPNCGGSAGPDGDGYCGSCRPITGKNPSCFVGSTPVLTSRGWFPIEEIAEGHSVTSFDSRNRLSENEVLKVLKSSYGRIWEVHTKTVSTPIRTTFGHAFLTTRGFKNTWQLKEGDILISINADGYRVENPVLNIVRTNSCERVYNLRVSYNYSYIVEGSATHCFGFARGIRIQMGRLIEMVTKKNTNSIPAAV